MSRIPSQENAVCLPGIEQTETMLDQQVGLHQLANVASTSYIANAGNTERPGTLPPREKQKITLYVCSNTPAKERTALKTSQTFCDHKPQLSRTHSFICYSFHQTRCWNGPLRLLPLPMCHDSVPSSFLPHPFHTHPIRDPYASSHGGRATQHDRRFGAARLVLKFAGHAGLSRKGGE